MAWTWPHAFTALFVSTDPAEGQSKDESAEASQVKERDRRERPCSRNPMLQEGQGKSLEDSGW